MKIGIDLGGTKTEGILIDNEGKELARNRIKTEKNYDGTIRGIISIVKKFETDFGESESVGIGMPGVFRNGFGKECKFNMVKWQAF
jgi:fructokinase